MVSLQMSTRILFIRDSTDESESSADTLWIIPLNDGGFRIHFLDTHSELKYYATMENHHDVLDYIESLFDLLPVDGDPYECIQLFVPAFPSVIYKTHLLSRVTLQNAILRLLRNMFRIRPIETKRTDPLRNASALPT